MKVYVNTQGRVMGPIDVERVLALQDNGRLSPDATVSDDKTNWIPITELRELIQRANEEAANVKPMSTGGESSAALSPSLRLNPGASYNAPQGYNQNMPYGAPQMGAPQGYNQGAQYGAYPQVMPPQGGAYPQAMPPQGGAYPQAMPSQGMPQGNNSSVCAACGQPIASTASVCPHCGTHRKFCPNCGAVIARTEQTVCTQCGCALGGSSSGKSAGTAALLSFLLVGAGQMYLGQVIKGIILLVIAIVLGGIAVEEGVVGLVAFVFWIVNIIDAHKQGKKAEEGRKIGDWDWF